jgi:hypothetical protein
LPRLRSPAARAATAATTTSSTSAASAAGPGSGSTLLSFIDSQRATAHLKAVRLLDCVLRFISRHVDERKAAGTPSLAIVDEFDGFDFAVAFENRTHFIFSSGEWQVANVDRRHSTYLTDLRASQARGFNTQTAATRSRGLHRKSDATLADYCWQTPGF